MNITFHYPPELMNLLIDTIPLLCKSKKDVLLFFKGAGVDDHVTNDLSEQVRINRDGINKFEIARTVLTRLNERGEPALRERREVLKRIVEFEDFSTCWPNDQLKAKGLVGEIRRVIDVKDSFTRIRQERDNERLERIAKREAEIIAVQNRKVVLDKIKRDLFALFADADKHRRGKALESVLNRLFDAYSILVSEAFSVRGDNAEGIVEQIDGVIELDGHHYFVEMKWWKDPVGVPEISQHMTRVFLRAEARAIIISATSFTGTAVATCKEALAHKVVVLCAIEELVTLLERGSDLRQFLKAKVNAAITHKNPLYFPIASGEV